MGLEIATIAAIGSLAVGAASTYAQIQAAGDQRAAEKKARQEQQAQSTVTAQDQARQQARQERLRRAQIVASSATTGTQQSSGELGGLAAVTSQAASNISNIREGQLASAAYSQTQQDIANAQGQQAQWQTIGGLAASGFNIFSNTAGFRSDVNNIFGGSGSPTTQTDKNPLQRNA